MAKSLPPATIHRLAKWLADEKFTSSTQLAKDLNISRTTLGKYRRLIRESGHSLADFSKLSSRQLQEAIEQQAVRKTHSERYAVLMSHLPAIWCRISEGESNLRICWVEYRSRHPDGYGYVQFTAHFHSWRHAHGFRAFSPHKWRVPDIASQDNLVLKKWRHSNNRLQWAKAVAILELKKGTQVTVLSEKLEKSPRLIKRWRQAYLENGLDGLRSPEHRHQSEETQLEIKRRGEQITELMHEPPELHGINRTSWSLEALVRAYEAKYGDLIGKSTISEYLRTQGYSFKKARRVLTSPDPEYLPKLEEITRILSGLQPDEVFFSVDEFGPFSVKSQGGRAFSPRVIVHSPMPQPE